MAQKINPNYALALQDYLDGKQANITQLAKDYNLPRPRLMQKISDLKKANKQVKLTKPQKQHLSQVREIAELTKSADMQLLANRAFSLMLLKNDTFINALQESSLRILEQNQMELELGTLTIDERLKIAQINKLVNETIQAIPKAPSTQIAIQNNQQNIKNSPKAKELPKIDLEIQMVEKKV